jgi:hypothetical protein
MPAEETNVLFAVLTKGASILETRVDTTIC